MAVLEQLAMKTNPEEFYGDRLRQKAGKLRQGFIYFTQEFRRGDQAGRCPSGSSRP